MKLYTDSESSSSLISPLAIAPMVDWTYTHFRVFMRLLAPHALLYTDMQTTGAVLHHPERALGFHPMEHPVALQLGGVEKDSLVQCVKEAEQYGFDEVNLNLGCPSARVQSGRFGACLMSEPVHVAECIAAMKKAVSIPVSAKTRIGIDDQDHYEFFSSFAHRLLDAGCDKLIVHARKAWLKGLNPKQNRTIPPLHYPYVYQFKQERPEIPVVINGNLTADAMSMHLKHVDGVMFGRLACQNPYAIALMHHQLYPGSPLKTRTDILRAYGAYLKTPYAQGVPLSVLLKPVLGLAYGLPFAKRFKETLLKQPCTDTRPLLYEAVDMLEAMEQPLEISH